MKLKLGPGELRARTPTQSKAAGLTVWETIYAPGFKIRAHSHKNAFVYLVLRGALTETCDRQTRTALPSTVIFHPAGQVHANHFLEAGASAFSVELDDQWLERLQSHSLALDAPAYFDGGRLPSLAAHLYREAHQTDTASALVTEGLALELLAQAARCRVTVTERKPPRWLQQAKELLHEQFATSLTLEEIASVAGVHPVYLSTTFRRQFGCTIGEYLRRLRIDDACRRLARSELPLAEVALEAGFANQSHFTRTFKRLTGLTPSEYRRSFSA
jgi:AraC family transcriptional regulator